MKSSSNYREKGGEWVTAVLSKRILTGKRQIKVNTRFIKKN